jgi:hypothetical protein
MEKVITNEMTKFLIFLGVCVMALLVMVSGLITKAEGSIKPYRKQTILYMLVAFLLFALIGLAALPAFIGDSMTVFILLQAYFLLLGFAHYYYMHQYLLWTGSKKAFGVELAFTVLLSLMGAIGFLIIYRLINKNGLQYIMVASALFFIIPFLLFNTFRRAIAIPPKIVKEWFYPVEQEVEEPEESKMKNLLVISFEFRKQTYDPHYTNFRAKAPVDMDFGKLFYFFINDYNERHPNSRIQFVNGSGEAHGWIFYKKPRWHSLITRYIDGEKTIFNNFIKENDVIICERSLI